MRVETCIYFSKIVSFRKRYWNITTSLAPSGVLHFRAFYRRRLNKIERRALKKASNAEKNVSLKVFVSRLGTRPRWPEVFDGRLRATYWAHGDNAPLWISPHFTIA